MKGVVIAIVVLSMVQQLMAEPTRAITCGQVDACLVPCMSYLVEGGTPQPACCDGVKNLKGMASNIADKRAACNCVKEAASRYSNIKDDAAQALPAKCGVQLDIPISKTTNCDA